jgi:hypothetical protein
MPYTPGIMVWIDTEQVKKLADDAERTAKDVRNKAMRRGKDCANEMTEVLWRLTPGRGQLRNAWKNKKAGELTWLVAPEGNSYGTRQDGSGYVKASNVDVVNYLVYGTRPHYINPRFTKALWWPEMANSGPVPFVLHPGITGEDFLSEAMYEVDWERHIDGLVVDILHDMRLY